MGLMDMLNPVKAAKKVGQQVQKLPGVGQLNKVAQGAAGAAQKFAPPGLKGIGPSVPTPGGLPNGWSPLPEQGMTPGVMSGGNSGGMMGGMAQGMMGKFGGMMRPGMPMMKGPQAPMQGPPPEQQQWNTPESVMSPMPDVPVGPMDPSAGMQQWMQRMKTRNTGINGGRSRGPLVQS